MPEPLAFYASHPHYVDHLAALWRGLPGEARGRFYVPEHLADYAAHGVHPTAIAGRRPAPVNLERVVVAGFVDLQHTRGARACLVEHGAGQTYNGARDKHGNPDNPAANHGGYPGGIGREAVDVFLCPGPHVADANEATYPDARTEVVGCPRLDPWLRLPQRDAGDPVHVAVVTFHWPCGLVPECGTAYDEYAEAVARLPGEFPELAWFATAHPRWDGRLDGWYRAHGFGLLDSWGQALTVGDLLIADNTSGMYEFAALGRPVIALNSRDYRRDVHHGLRFWTHVPGVEVDTPDELAGVVAAHVAEPATGWGRRNLAAAHVYAHRDGTATARALDVLLDWWEAGD